MATVRFLRRAEVWRRLAVALRSPGRALVAVAYLGRGGAALLPLRRGDYLVVDMSERAVMQGVTDPREIRKLMRRGVQVFTRDSLHAKCYVVGSALIVGSANVSRNARDHLDEAAILTTSPAAVTGARRFVMSLCTEPVRQQYVAKCLRLYRPPTFTAATTRRTRGGDGKGAKLWFISNISWIALPQEEEEQLEATISSLPRRQHEVETERDWIRYSKLPTYYADIKPGNWAIRCFHEGGGRRSVWGPAQVLGKRAYVRRGKRSYVLVLEEPTGIEQVGWARFRERVRTIVPALAERPRTQPVVDPEQADALLRLWTQTGRLALRHWRGQG